MTKFLESSSRRSNCSPRTVLEEFWIPIEHGSEQDDLWGANWYPEEQHLEFESLINIRPRLGNRSIIIQSEVLRQQVADIICEMLRGI